MNIEQYFAKFFHGTKDPSLKAMHFFMEEFEHPEKNYRIIHIAGTNGKGSVAEMLSRILIDAGYKVGKFMSPHLIRYNERISVNNECILDEEYEQLISLIDPKIEKYHQESGSSVTFFELESTMAFLYFAQKKCDFIVLETGLGGLYDCTNICQPLISVITSIGYDHMQILGNTLEEIAVQKAGIIKENSNTVFVRQEESVNKVISDTCQEKNNCLYMVAEGDIQNYSFDRSYQKFDYKDYQGVEVNLKGYKQCVNACVVLECMGILSRLGFDIEENVIRSALKRVVHKARFEVISEKPLVIYDGAHNEPAIDNLKRNLATYYSQDKKVFIISLLNTKDYKKVLQLLCDDPETTYIFTGGNNPETYISQTELCDYAKTISPSKELYAMTLEESIRTIKNKYADCTTFVVGSFYIYGDVVKKVKEFL